MIKMKYDYYEGDFEGLNISTVFLNTDELEAFLKECIESKIEVIINFLNENYSLIDLWNDDDEDLEHEFKIELTADLVFGKEFTKFKKIYELERLLKEKGII